MLQARRFGAEDDSMPVKPELPAAEKEHRGQRFGRSPSLCVHSPELRDRRYESWIPTDMSPEAFGEGASRDQVVGGLW